VPGALIALQNADRSLSRSDKPQFITIRRAIARYRQAEGAAERGFGRRRPAPRQRHRANRHAADAVRRKADPAGAAGKKAKAKVVHGKDGKPVKRKKPPARGCKRCRTAGTAGAARCGPTCAS
jgi:uroporphyrin-3 C-methyltransferase/uroporphyrinogen III methyltransferase/synthase